nr:hypothetical protein [Tanacetum cinerariifolium]
HPAVDHQGHRARDPAAARARGYRHPAVRAVFRFCAGAGGQVRGAVARGGGGQRDGRGDGWGACAAAPGCLSALRNSFLLAHARRPCEGRGP